MNKPEYEKKFKKLNKELYDLIEETHKCNNNYFKVMEMMGGESVNEDIRRLYYDANHTDDSYAAGVFNYFKDNVDKHEMWIASLELHIL